MRVFFAARALDAPWRARVWWFFGIPAAAPVYASRSPHL